MIKVLIVDDQALARDGLALIVGAADDVEVVGTAEDGAQALDQIAQHTPDLVLMDLKMPTMNGVQATRRIRERFPDVRVLVLTTYDADDWVLDAIRAGARGYLLKDSPRDTITDAIRRVMAGETIMSPTIASKLYQFVQQGTPTDSTLAEQLNPREREILSHLANGRSNAEIAERIHLAEGTVRNYVSSIFSKLDVTDRTQAAAIAWRHGLVNED
jgi:two-component system, NarL family, response regulator LiaR